MSDCDDWQDLIEAARATVRRAADGDVHAGRDIIANSVHALYGLMIFEEPDPSKLRQGVEQLDDERRVVFHMPPTPEQLVYLQGLLASLNRVLAGVEPDQALNIKKPPRRPDDPNINQSNALVFMCIGGKLDALVAAGARRRDAPVRRAIEDAAIQMGVSLDVAKNAWKVNGGEEQWRVFSQESDGG